MTVTTSYWPADISAPVLDTTVGGLLRAAADRHGDTVALVPGAPAASGRTTWTHGELLAEAEAVAQALLGRFDPGERVAVWSPGVPEWVVLEFACALAGLVLVTVNPAYRAGELAYVLRQSGAAGLFLVPEWRGNPMAAALEEVRADLPALREVEPLLDLADFAATGSLSQALPHVVPEDPAQIQYTSGTTGFPKGALLHHRGITNNARFVAERLEVDESSVWVNPLPLFHTGGCVLGTLGPVSFGATHVPVAAFDPALVLELVESRRATVLGGVPTMLIALMEHPDFATRDLSSLRVVLSGGSLVPAELVRRIEGRLGVAFSTVFGMTEASPVITQTRLDDDPVDKAETVGRALPQTEVAVVEPSGHDVLALGTRGEICTRGYLVMRGYHEMADATAETIDADGWLHTGDLGTMDERGYVRVEGRLKDMIIRGGENIYPREIEEVLFAHPAVADVAVLGLPDERWGETVAAVVRLSSEGARPTPAELSAYVRQRLAAHKVPRQWAFVDAFPMTGSGKIQKFVLRDQLIVGELRADPA